MYHVFMNSREIIKKLKADGWLEVCQEGSHKQFRHPIKKGKVTVQSPKHDFSMDLIKSIEKQSGIKLR